jgi:transcriptional regulator with GAF, ATPase, and Fis domain
VAPTSTTVAIYGETGTGKELVARAIHQLSPRSAHPFFAINCASIPESLLESELFGYEKGAFTGADVRRRGLFEQASGSTLLLDEIGDLPLNLQGKILRVLQEREIRRLGAGEPVPVDVRILSATRRDLSKMVSAGAFREDLYYRINTFPIQIPPLRERLADLPALVSHFLEKFRDLRNPPVEQVSPSAMDSLAHYAWPGNVRELSACIERAVILAEGTSIDQLHLPREVRTEASAAEAIRLPAEGVDFEELERSLLIQALERTGGVATRAAPLLGMSYRTFQYRLHKHEIGGDGDRQNGPVQDESPDEEVVDEES